MVRGAVPSGSAAGLKRHVPSGSPWAAPTMAAKALSPERESNSAWTTRPESKSSPPSPASRSRESRPVFPPRAMACTTSVRSSTPKEPSKVRAPASARGTVTRGGSRGGGGSPGSAGGATWRSSFEIRSSTVDTTKSPATSMSTPAWATAHGVGRVGPESRRNGMSWVAGSLRMIEQNSTPSMSSVRLPLTMRSGRSRSSVVRAKEALVADVTW